MLQLLVGRRGRDQKAVLVARRQPADNACARNRAVHNRDQVCQFGFKDRVEVLRRPNRHQTVAVGQVGEDADFVRVFKLRSHSHGWVCLGCAGSSSAL
ncbi:hypothetical protein KCU88_g88, partial [Aureobasidium melanogenum]